MSENIKELIPILVYMTILIASSTLFVVYTINARHREAERKARLRERKRQVDDARNMAEIHELTLDIRRARADIEAKERIAVANEFSTYVSESENGDDAAVELIESCLTNPCQTRQELNRKE